MTTDDISRTAEWQALTDHANQLRDVHLRQLFADDPGRVERLTVTAGDLDIDLSKHRVTDETIRLLVVLADRPGLGTRIDREYGSTA